MISLHNWLLASRPKTLVAALVPVMIGAAYASRSVEIHWPILLCTLFSALCIQIGTNLANDYSDFRRGADTSKRLGPTRVTQAGLIAPARVKAGAITSFALATLLGVPLIVRGGWPILAIGALGILSGWMYTGGPLPYGYRGLGELFVMLFFGVAAVTGTHYVLALTWDPLCLLLAVAPALHAAALLAVNNLRDIDTDREAGKRTLAVIFGRRFAQIEYLLFVLLPFLLPVILFYSGFARPILLPIVALPLLIPPVGLVLTRTDGASLIRALAGTARLQLIFGSLLVLGLVL